MENPFVEENNELDGSTFSAKTEPEWVPVPNGLENQIIKRPVKEPNHFRKKQRSENNSEKNLEQNYVKEAQIKIEDEFDITGKKVASDLRGIDPTQRIFVEKIIADAIYFGRLGKLNENSRMQL